MHPDLTKIIFSEEELRDCVKRMGAQITADYADAHDLLVIGILKGAAIFMTDLVRSIDLPLEMDFMVISSYGDAATTSGRVKIVQDLSCDIKGRDVIIAEDILDTGRTLSKLLKVLELRDPRSISIAALLRKEGAQQFEVPCKYEGFACPDEFVVGYGLDYAQHYRNLPYIGALDRKVYAG